jgi:hypothetical protein
LSAPASWSRRAALVGALAFVPGVLAGQGAPRAQLAVRVVPETVTVGQPFMVSVRVQAPAAAIIRFPTLPDSGDALEALDPRVVVDAPGANIDRTASYRMSAWDIGVRHPALSAVVVTIGGVEERFEVRVPPVVVRTLLPADTADRVPKPAREPVLSSNELWKLWLLLAALAAVLLGWWWRRPSAVRPPPAEREAFQVADAAFAALARLALHQAGEPARHVIAHIDVMREYLGRRFPAAHQGQTPAEFARVLAAEPLPTRHDKVAALLLRDAELRFATTSVEPVEADALATEAIRIVREVQEAHDARLRAADRGPQRPRRR